MTAPRRGPRRYAAAALGWLALANASPASKGKKVFAHYMVGDSTKAHRQQDILDAKAIGIDGFSLNIGKTDKPFVRSTLNDMFDFAGGQDFGLHISMDLWAAGDNRTEAAQGVPDYKKFFVDFFGHAAYEHGANGWPMVTTFSDGGTNNKTWDEWRESFAQQVFLIPNMEGTPGFWTMHPAWWEHWGEVLDGYFTWETAWPERKNKGGKFPGDISPDLDFIKGALSHKKKYMIGLSPLQYKDAYDTNIYRAGHNNLPTRMESILAHREDIQYVCVLTWNDGPESHYIGNLWPEQNNNPEPAKYMHLPHKGWQRIIGSFNAAFKGDGIMRPLGNDVATGAFWYKTILSDTKCPEDEARIGIDKQYLTKPEGYANARDAGNYAIVLPQGASGWSLRVHSGGKTDTITGLKAGLNYGDTMLRAGTQRVELINSAGEAVAVASGGRCVYGGSKCPDCTYNVNPTVVEFGQDRKDAKCNQVCKLKSGSGSGSGGGGGSGSGSGALVTLDGKIYNQDKPTIKCHPPCEYVFPPRTLAQPTTITFPPFRTSIERGDFKTTSWTLAGKATTTTVFETVTITTLITVPPLTTSVIGYWSIHITSGKDESTTTIWPYTSIRPPPFTIQLSSTNTLPSTTRTITPRPWPWPTDEPTDDPSKTHTPTTTHKDGDFSVVHTGGDPDPTCSSNCGDKCVIFCDWPPCLLNCGDTNNDHSDPRDPNRPSGPSGGNDGDDEDDDDDDDEADTDIEGDAYLAKWEFWKAAQVSEDEELAAILVVLADLTQAGDFGKDFDSDEGPKPTNTKPSDPPKSSDPPKASKFVIIALTEQLSGTTWLRNWDVWGANVGDTVQVCNTRRLLSKTAGQDAATRGYPEIDLKFDAHGHEGCKYESAGKKNIGKMTCPDVSSIKCEKSLEWDEKINCNGVHVYPDLYCEW